MIICIGREFGSGGHEIGQLVAEKLSLTLYDQELVTEAIKKCSIEYHEQVKSADEKKPNPWLYDVLYGTEEKELRGKSVNDVIFGLQRKVILDAAKKDNCVFVGRCADYILEEAGIKHISVFIAAPFTARVERKMQQLNISEKAAIALVRKKDKQRKSYYDYNTGGSWGRPHTYDFCINSHAKGIKQTAEELAAFVGKIK
ncbi:MAG: AAA family ATPase [Oscillospiraceae bacterium]